MAAAPVCSASAAICVWLNIGGSGASTTPRCKQPSIATADSIEWRPEQDHDVPGADAGVREAMRDGDGGATKLGVGDFAILEHERDAVGVLARPSVEFTP